MNKSRERSRRWLGVKPQCSKRASPKLAIWISVSRARQANGTHRALARLARHRYIAAHHARELAGDSKAEARAATLRRPRRACARRSAPDQSDGLRLDRDANDYRPAGGNPVGTPWRVISPRPPAVKAPTTSPRSPKSESLAQRPYRAVSSIPSDCPAGQLRISGVYSTELLTGRSLLSQPRYGFGKTRIESTYELAVDERAVG
jgi:hypothetical protein